MAELSAAEIDAELSAQLARAAGRRVRAAAGAVVEMGGAGPRIRYGLVGRARPDRAFEIGSVTKGLTGMLLAEAIARGEVTLDTAAEAIVPALAGAPLGAVTLRALATHSSGLPRLAGGAASAWRGVRLGLLGMDPYRGLTPERVLAAAGRRNPDPPGRFRYSNLGAALCGQLLARAAGRPYEALLRERILEPAGLTATWVSVPGHTAPPGRSALGLPRQPWVMDGYAPAGGVAGTIADMASLAAGLLTATVPGAGALQVIDDGAGDGRRHGMFWIVQPAPGSGAPLVWHNGRTGGYAAFLGLRCDRGRAIVALADRSDAAVPERLAAVLRDARA